MAVRGEYLKIYLYAVTWRRRVVIKISVVTLICIEVFLYVNFYKLLHSILSPLTETFVLGLVHMIIQV